MEKFDFTKEMENIRNFIKTEQYREVGVNFGLILEMCLKHLYTDIRNKAEKEVLELIDSKEKEIGIKIATPLAGPKPGRAPNTVPRKQPIKAKVMF